MSTNALPTVIAVNLIESNAKVGADALSEQGALDLSVNVEFPEDENSPYRVIMNLNLLSSDEESNFFSCHLVFDFSLSRLLPSGEESVQILMPVLWPHIRPVASLVAHTYGIGLGLPASPPSL